MFRDPKQFERTWNRRVANGMWYFLGLTTAFILVKMAQKKGDDVLYGIIIFVALYFCYSFFQRFVDAPRVHGEGD